MFLCHRSAESVKLLVVGPNRALHRALAALLALRERDAALWRKCLFSLCVVPDGQNDLATFLAWKDPWYARAIFAPFGAELSLWPRLPRALSPSADGAAADARLPRTLPGGLLCDAAFDYLRHASVACPVGVWACECWESLRDASRRNLAQASADDKPAPDDASFASADGRAALCSRPAVL